MPQVPAVKQNKILVSVSLAESAMIKKLRQYEFGQFTIYKQQGEPKRIEVVGSEIISESDGFSLREQAA